MVANKKYSPKLYYFCMGSFTQVPPLYSATTIPPPKLNFHHKELANHLMFPKQQHKHQGQQQRYSNIKNNNNNSINNNNIQTKQHQNNWVVTSS